MKTTLILIIAGVMLAAGYDSTVRFKQTIVNSTTLAVPAAPVLPEGEVLHSPPSMIEESGSLEQSEFVTNLLFVRQKLELERKQIEQRHSIKMMLIGIGKDDILVKVRRTGDVETPLSNKEIEAVKQTLFDIAGGEFPLQLSAMECCKSAATITGKITAYDKEQNRVLIVNEQKKNGNTDDPEANWVGMQADAVLVVDGIQPASGLNESLVGRDVKVWTTGVTMLSYPGQTSAIKMVIE